jgi:hypothetical protein
MGLTVLESSPLRVPHTLGKLNSVAAPENSQPAPSKKTVVDGAIIADFRGAKSTHIPHDKPQRFQGKRMLFVRGFSA